MKQVLPHTTFTTRQKIKYSSWNRYYDQMWECHFFTIQRMGPDGIKGSKITLNLQLLAITIFHFWRAYFCRCLSHLLSSALSNEKWLLVTRVYTGPAIHNKALTARSGVPRPILSEALSVTEGLWPATGHCTHCTHVLYSLYRCTHQPSTWLASLSALFPSDGRCWALDRAHSRHSVAILWNRK